jgi:glutamate--cysteine ligase
MDYNKQVNLFVDYFKNSEASINDFNLGVEIEHLILHRNDFSAVSFYENKGIEDILKELTKKGWEPIYEGNYLIGLYNKEATITLERGAQFELSINPKKSIKEIEKIYLSFITDILPVLEEWDKVLLCLAYQPVSSVKDIPHVPKKRYKYLKKYREIIGKCTPIFHTGTASIQCSIDYKDEDDFRKKCRVATFLSPVIYSMFDNAPFFEGKLYKDYALRAQIWDNYEKIRCGFIKGVFNRDFNYRAYADYVLNIPPIVVKKDDQFEFTGVKLLKDILNPEQVSHTEIEHFLSVVYPDVRARKYIEIRMCDAIPYPLNMGYLTLLKGLLYDKENLDRLFTLSSKYSEKVIKLAKDKIKTEGIETEFAGTTINKFFYRIIEMAGDGLIAEERKYLSNIEDWLKDGKLPPRRMILENYHHGKKNALKQFIISPVNIKGTQ